MPRTILITGCSDGGLGAELAIAFHAHGDRVFATARNPSKMAELEALGIETLALDVLSDESVKQCVDHISNLTSGSLDVLVNNAGAGYNMPLVDASIPECQKLFDLNVWAVLRTVQHFLPLLGKSSSRPMIVNNTSVASVIGMPWFGPYCASKAAAAMITENLRLELQPFKIKVIDLKTGSVRSHFYDNLALRSKVCLPETSIYSPARAEIESVMGEGMDKKYMAAGAWAKAVVGDLSQHCPPHHIWRGDGATMGRLGSLLPVGVIDFRLKKMTCIDVLEANLPHSDLRT